MDEDYDQANDNSRPTIERDHVVSDDQLMNNDLSGDMDGQPMDDDVYSD